MSFFKKWREKRKEAKRDTKEVKRPDSSYDIYNQNETLTLQADLNENLNSSISEKQKLEITDTSLDVEVKGKDKSRETKTRTTEVKKTSTQSKTKTSKDKEKKDMAEKKGRNIYYVSVRKDKNGKKLGWEVKKENADKITKLCETKEEAIEYVKEKAGNQGSTCIIRKLDGSIEKTMKFNSK